VITKSVPPRLFVAAPPVQAVARVKVPLTTAETMEQFWAGLTPLPPRRHQEPENPSEP
jgi:hypothetical protein